MRFLISLICDGLSFLKADSRTLNQPFPNLFWNEATGLYTKNNLGKAENADIAEATARVSNDV